MTCSKSRRTTATITALVLRGDDAECDEQIADGCLEMEDDETLSIICDEDGQISDSGDAVSRTYAEWAREKGRGFLCSENY